MKIEIRGLFKYIKILLYPQIMEEVLQVKDTLFALLFE